MIRYTTALGTVDVEEIVGPELPKHLRGPDLAQLVEALRWLARHYESDDLDGGYAVRNKAGDLADWLEADADV